MSDRNLLYSLLCLSVWPSFKAREKIHFPRDLFLLLYGKKSTAFVKQWEKLRAPACEAKMPLTHYNVT